MIIGLSLYRSRSAVATANRFPESNAAIVGTLPYLATVAAVAYPSAIVELYLNRRMQSFTALNSWTGNHRLRRVAPAGGVRVAAYIETLQRQAAPPTVRQHMAAIRMLFSWLTEKGVLAMNPAREVKTERF